MLGFRVWDIKNKKMIYADGHDNDFSLSADGLLQYDNRILYDDNYISTQSTGLIDMAGKEIYEGDVLEFRTIDKEGEFDMSYYLFVDNVTKFLLTFNREYFENDASEPIIIKGNRYENPELMERIND